MKKGTGGILIIGLALILVIKYSSVEKQTRKQSAYEFFHPQASDYAGVMGSSDDNSVQIEWKQPEGTTEKRPHLVKVEGLDYLLNLSNVPKEESKALLVWAQMRLLLSRSDSLPETAQGIKEAAVAWKELLSVIEEKRVAESDSQEDKDCPHSIQVFNSTISIGASILEIPCGLVEDSSISIIGVPDGQQGSFQIELIGSKMAEESNHPIVLQYNVFLPGDNFTKEPVIIQNTWTNEGGWGKEERCPSRGSNIIPKVDGLVKCNEQIVRSSMGEKLNASHVSSGKSTNVSDVSSYRSENFPFSEGSPFTVTVWAGAEGFHMTVNGRHETSFAYREKLEPWLITGVRAEGGLKVISALAKSLPVSEDPDLVVDVEQLKAPPITKKRLVMLIGVFSSGNNFERRMALRRSWMQYEAVRSGEVAVRFFIGLHKNKQVNWELWQEAQAYGDIQLMPFVDYYSLLTIKTVAISIMGTKILPAKYIIKTDDDAFLRIDEVLSNLKTKNPDGLLYGLISFESTPHRDTDNKWYISTEEWPHAQYPPWAHGPGYVISRDIAKFIVQGHMQRNLKLFKLEDVAVGIWIQQYEQKGHKVQYHSDDRFNNAGCESNYILAHYQSPRLVLCLWEKLQKEHEANCCE